MRSLRTDLTDRSLRFDGVSIVTPEKAAELLSRGVLPSELRIQGDSEEIQLFNQQVAEAERLLTDADEPIRLDMSWRLPESYKSIDIGEDVRAALAKNIQRLGYSEELQVQAHERIELELAEIKRRGMIEFMATIMYVLAVFREKGVVWGVGRGSSCASYVLFILGLHSVDALKHQIPLEEFFHD